MVEWQSLKLLVVGSIPISISKLNNMNNQIQKLVIVTRGDLTDGYKAVQSTHAAINFIFEHPSRADPWYQSNYLVQLEVKNEKQLKLLIQNCERNNLTHTIFREPDIGNEITAIAIEPSPVTQKLVKKIPLLFKNKIKQDVNTIKDYGNESQSVQQNKNFSLQETIR